jgi:hypothetical protein
MGHITRHTEIWRHGKMDVRPPIIRYNKFKNRGILKTVNLADLHFGAFAPKEQYLYLKKQFLEKIQPFEYDVLNICGDIFDHKFMSESDPVMYGLMFVDEAIQDALSKNALVVILKGTSSHDSNQLKLFYHYLNKQSLNIAIVETIKFIDFRGARILCIPELYDVPKEVYEQSLFYSGGYDICLLHGVISGAMYIADLESQGLHSSRPVFRITDFCNCRNVIIGGHIHTPMCLEKYMYYVGSPYAWTYADDHTKGFLIVFSDLDNNTHYAHMEPIISKVYKTIELDTIMETPIEEIISYINTYKSDNNIDYLRLTIKAHVNDLTRTNMQFLINHFRGNTLIKIDRSNFKNESKLVVDEELLGDEYAFLLDSSLDYKEKFVKFVNQKMGSEYTTVDELNKYLSGEL